MKYKIVVDKQPRSNPSKEKKEYEINIEELRIKDDVYDSLIITKDEDYVIRRLSLSEYGVLNVLTEPKKENIPNLNIELFEGDNYIYLIDMTGNKFYAEYLIKNDFTDTYIMKSEAKSIIEQEAGRIELSVEEKLNDYTTTEEFLASLKIVNDAINSRVSKNELGTEIEQNWEHVKYAWNQISEFIQLEIIANTPVLAIRDESKNLLMALNKTGQDFYKNNKIFGEMGIETINEDGIAKNYITFSVNINEKNEINDGMAWGFKDKKGNFCPILFVKNFYAGSENSDDAYGQLVLNDSDLLLDGLNAGIIAGSVHMYGGDVISPGIIFEDINTGNQLFRVMPSNNLIAGGENGYISILNSLSFYENQGGSDSFKIGNDNNYCLMTDEGYFTCNTFNGGTNGFTSMADNSSFAGQVDINNFKSSVYALYVQGNANFTGNIYASNISSDRRLKKNIKDSNKKALDIIKQIKHRQFDMKKDNKHYEIGYIAQELEEIEPNFVLKREKTEKFEERYYINELPIIATITKAIQEQQEQIEKLIERIEILEKKEATNGNT